MSLNPEGIYPPPHALRVPSPSSLRRACVKCSKMHDTCVQNSYTGEVLERLEKCIDCIMMGDSSVVEH